jgi:hypothetical protein
MAESSHRRQQVILTLSYNTSVFVNCPFDLEYRPILHALPFSIQDCGFLIKTALGTNDSGETRLRKIEEMIRDCWYSVHDLCRVEADTKPASGAVTKGGCEAPESESGTNRELEFPYQNVGEPEWLPKCTQFWIMP